MIVYDPLWRTMKEKIYLNTNLSKNTISAPVNLTV